MAVEYAEANAGAGGAKFAVDSITEGANTLAVPYVKLMSGTDASNAVIPGDITNGLDVDVTRVQGTVAVTQSGAWNVTADTELSPAAALADATTNPTVTSVGAFPHVFNGTTWDRARGDIANGLDVDVTRVQGVVDTNVTNAVKISDGNVGSGVVKTAFVNATAAGNTVVVAAVTGKKIRVMGYRIQAHGTVNVKFVDTAATPADLTFTWKFQDREGAIATAPVGGFEFESGTSLGVQINLSAAVQVGAQVVYVEV